MTAKTTIAAWIIAVLVAIPPVFGSIIIIGGVFDWIGRAP